MKMKMKKTMISLFSKRLFVATLILISSPTILSATKGGIDRAVCETCSGVPLSFRDPLCYRNFNKCLECVHDYPDLTLHSLYDTITTGTDDSIRQLAKSDFDVCQKAVFFDFGANDGDTLRFVQSLAQTELTPAQVSTILTTKYAKDSVQTEHKIQTQALLQLFATDAEKSGAALYDIFKQICVVSFEGTSTYFNKLVEEEKKLKDLNLPFVHVASRTALMPCDSNGTANDFVEFAISYDSHASSAEIKTDRSIKSRAVSVGHLLHLARDVPIWIIKMDVEGTEYKLFDDLLTSGIFRRHLYNPAAQIIFFMEFHGMKTGIKNRKPAKHLLPPWLAYYNTKGVDGALAVYDHLLRVQGVHVFTFF